MQRKIIFLVIHTGATLLAYPAVSLSVHAHVHQSLNCTTFPEAVLPSCFALCCAAMHKFSCPSNVTIKSPAITSSDFRSRGKHNSRNKMINKDIYAVFKKSLKLLQESYVKEWGLLFRCGFQYMFHIKMFVL